MFQPTVTRFDEVTNKLRDEPLVCVSRPYHQFSELIKAVCDPSQLARAGIKPMNRVVVVSQKQIPQGA